jgi:two-component system LytT family sensor kinase
MGAVIGGAFHWPTALVVLGAVGLCWTVVALRRQQRARGFVSEVDRATYQTLHTASLAAVHLTGGLTADDAEEAAEPLRAMLGTPALAICDRAGLVAWDGAGGTAHRRQAFDHAGECIQSGRTAVVRAITCADPDCLVRTAVVAPLVVDEAVVGSLAAYGPEASPGLARATEEVARYVSSQLEAAAVGRERGRAMEAELRALRAQISPHFIYNSLAATASFVRTDPERARELLLEFADFTRYALRRGGAYTTLSEELRNVERYLVLEQARFGDRLGVHLLIAPEVLPVAIPYLVVQPLVENAVRHGLAPKVGPGSVTITAADAGSNALITVEDDGVGAEPSVIQRVLDGDTGRDSVGLGNVDARLRQVYGDDHGLVVETAPEAGMKVSFTVPKFAPGVVATA